MEKLFISQLNGLRFFDIVITGGLIAGGSDGVHKLTAVNRKFIEGVETAPPKKCVASKVAIACKHSQIRKRYS